MAYFPLHVSEFFLGRNAPLTQTRSAVFCPYVHNLPTQLSCVDSITTISTLIDRREERMVRMCGENKQKYPFLNRQVVSRPLTGRFPLKLLQPRHWPLCCGIGSVANINLPANEAKNIHSCVFVLRVFLICHLGRRCEGYFKD